MKKQLLLLMALVITSIGYSQTFTDNFITYNVTSTTNNTVGITGYDMAGGSIVNIGESVIYNSINYTITSIGSAAFSDKSLTSVTIGNNVVTIANAAFFNNQINSIAIGISVQSIGLGAFQNNQLSSVVIPDSVINLESQVFSGNNIANVVFGIGVTEIPSLAFFNNNLTSITIPNHITSIGFRAFDFNTSLTNLTLGTNLTTIGGLAFRDCPLNCVVSKAVIPSTIVTGTNDSFSNRGNINVVVPNGALSAYTNATWTGFQSLTEELSINDTFVTDNITYKVTSVNPATVVITNYNVNGGTVVNIPETVTASCSKSYTVTEIGSGAFSQKQITSITIPNSITNIEHHAFNNNQLTSLLIPQSVINIGYLAFSNNPLNTVISLNPMPPTINTSSTIDTFGTSNRSSINLVITNNTTNEYVTNAGALWTGFKMVFEATSPTTVEVSNYDSANGTAVIIPSTVTAGSNVFNVVKIENSAFENIGLTSVTIPNSVTNIGISAFSNNNLTSLSIPDSVTIIGTTAFATNSITNLSIGANVTTIGIGAFVENNLTNVTIPSNVSSIGLLAFSANPLTNVTTFATTPPTITTGTNDTFSNNRSNIHLHIPSGTTGAYVTNAGALWTGFNPVTEDALSTSNFELENDVKLITTSNQLVISYSNNVRLENYTIYNMTGAKVKEGIESYISIEDMSKGIYILELNFSEGKVIKKFAK